MTSTDTTWTSDYWHSTGQQAYDADDLPITPACPVCGSLATARIYRSPKGPTTDRYASRGELIGRACLDQPRHEAAE